MQPEAKRPRMEVVLRGCSDEELLQISASRCLALSLPEMQAIQSLFDRLEREPTDVELECLAQTWSEHCKHKVFQAEIEYESPEGVQTIDGLFPTYIVKATEDVRRAHGDADYCLSVFKDNAGVIRFHGPYGVAFKVETHNHPSALDPYGGSATGIGGVIRDILGTGLGAKPFANTDVFCVAPVDTPFEDLPAGTLHPRRILKGIVEGVRDYGNRMGIATVNGSVNFSPKYLGNPLVYCGTVGLIDEKYIEKECQPGDLLISIGGRTGRDGLHGATFSSQDLTEESSELSGGAVQIGNPVVEKRAEEAVLRARNEGLLTDVTDCGAGGFSSSIGEMTKHHGAMVRLDNAPLKYEGLEAWEIFLSEAQERMLVAIRPENLERVAEICRQEAVEHSIIGEVTDTGRLEVVFRGETVCDLDMEFLHKGVPRKRLKAEFKPIRTAEPSVPASGDLTDALIKVLKCWDVCSKEWIIRQYDHEVQGGSVAKPIQGPGEGPGDAAVWNPLPAQDSAVIVSHGINARYGEIDPYWMAAAVIDEALRGIVASGGSLDRVAILDNFCLGNPMNPSILGALVRMTQACYDMATAYNVPFISGKDSFYNQFQQRGETIAIPPTLLISAIAVLDHWSHTKTIDLKNPGAPLFLLGTTRRELGGSCYYQTLGAIGNDVPRTDPRANAALMQTLAAAVRKGWVASIHDLSDGGLGVALAEMAFAGGLGFVADLERASCEGDLVAAEILFSESTGRFAVEVLSEHEAEFSAAFREMPAARMGTVSEDDRVLIRFQGEAVVDTTVDLLRAAWREPFAGW